MRIILLGSPGAGKGSLAAEISKKYPVAHISTGDILRENVKNNTPLGVKARTFMDAGGLVSDEIVIAMMEERIKRPDCEKGFILDGFPRTVSQAEALEKILDKAGIAISSTVFLDVDEDLVIRRLSGRRICRSCGAIYNVSTRPSLKGNICEICGGELYQREDDREDIVRQRLGVYYKDTAPLISYFENKRSFLRLKPNDRGDIVLEDFEKALGWAG